MIDDRELYKTIQIHSHVKEQIVDYCNKKGLKIGRFVETLFLQAVSGSNSIYSGSSTSWR